MFKQHRVIFIIMAISLIFSLFVSFERMEIESENKKVDIVIDYDEMEKLALQSDNDLEWYFGEFKKMGITKVGLLEESFLTLDEKNTHMSAQIMDAVIKTNMWKTYPKEVQAFFEGFDIYDVFIEIDDQSLFQYIDEQYRKRYDLNKYKTYSYDDHYYMMLDGQVKDTLFESLRKLVGGDDESFVAINEIVSLKFLYLD